MKDTLDHLWPRIIAVLTAIAAFIDFDPSVVGNKPMLVSLSKFIMIGGFAAIGFVVKPKNVTGGTVVNKSNDPTIVAETAGLPLGSTTMPAPPAPTTPPKAK